MKLFCYSLDTRKEDLVYGKTMKAKPMGEGGSKKLGSFKKCSSLAHRSLGEGGDEENEAEDKYT